MSLNLLKLFEKACFIRAFELEIARQCDAGEVPGLAHLSTGTEVADAALAATLDPTFDKVTGSHRSHGLVLAVGADPVKIASEILGRIDGLSGGMAGTQHLIAPEAGFLTSNGIVGAQVPLAAGAALTAKTMKTGGIGVAVFGDGAVNQGAVLETMNLAVALGLPMVFVLYNNGVAQTTGAAFASGGDSFTERAASFGLKVFAADSCDIDRFGDALEQAAASARAFKPAFIEVIVGRDDGHYYGELQASTDNKNEGDAIRALEAKLLENDVDQLAYEQAHSGAKNRAHMAVAAALTAPKAGRAQLQHWISIAGDRV